MKVKHSGNYSLVIESSVFADYSLVNESFALFAMMTFHLFSIKMIRIKRWKLSWHLQKSKNHYPSIKRLNKKVDQERRKYLQRSKRQKTVKCVDMYFINTSREVH